MMSGASCFVLPAEEFLRWGKIYFGLEGRGSCGFAADPARLRTNRLVDQSPQLLSLVLAWAIQLMPDPHELEGG